MESTKIPLFIEKQKFDQWWFRILVSIGPAILWFAFIQQIILKKQFGSNPASDVLLIILWILFGILMPLFLLNIQLITIITTDGIYIRFIPFYFKYRRFDFTDIEEYEVRKYKVIAEYGGYGIRGTKKNRAYNVKGDTGLQIIFKDGNKLLIGTQKPEEIQMAVQSVLKK